MAVIARRGYRGRVVRSREENAAEPRVVSERRGGGIGMVLARLIWLATTLLVIILAFRFFFTLFGANPSNGFANFIYTISRPPVSPFFGIFNYNYHLGAAHFEAYTLVAIAVYAVIGWALGYLFTLGRRY